MISAVIFVFVAITFCLLSLIAIIGVTELRMSGSEAIERDGLVRGTRAPAWRLPDSSGKPFSSPPNHTPFQVVIFTDHSLRSFPSVIDGLRALCDEESLEVMILLDRRNDLAEPMLRILGLDMLPVVAGSRSLYGSYNVRVKPWAIFVDSDGLVRGSSLINHAWQLAKLWALAQIPLSRNEATDRAQLSRRPRMTV
jgi:hypothetical protein